MHAIKYSWCDSKRATLSILRLSLIARNSVSSCEVDSTEITVVAVEVDVDNSISDVVLGGTCVPFPCLDPIIIKMNKNKDEQE